MDLTLTRETLFRELQHLQTIVKRKTTVPILANILLETLGNEIFLTATDLDVSLRCGCDADVRVGGALTVSARKLFDIVRLAPADADIQLRIDKEAGPEGNWMEVSYARSRFKLAALGRSDFPEIGEAEGQAIHLDAALVRNMISRCVFAITQEESRYTLGGALAVINPSSVALITTDGHRLVVVKKEEEVDVEKEELRILIPKNALVELVKLGSEEGEKIEIKSGERQISFRLGRRLLTSRVLTGEFPNYEMVIPKDNDKDVHIGTVEFTSSLKRAAVMADEQTRAVTLSLGEGQVEVTSGNTEAEEATEIIEAEYNGVPVKMGFNAQYLLEFLSVIDTNKVVLSLKDPETQGLLKPGEGSDYDLQYVVMPMGL